MSNSKEQFVEDIANTLVGHKQASDTPVEEQDAPVEEQDDVKFSHTELEEASDEENDDDDEEYESISLTPHILEPLVAAWMSALNKIHEDDFGKEFLGEYLPEAFTGHLDADGSLHLIRVDLPRGIVMANSASNQVTIPQNTAPSPSTRGNRRQSRAKYANSVELDPDNNEVPFTPGKPRKKLVLDSSGGLAVENE